MRTRMWVCAALMAAVLATAHAQEPKKTGTENATMTLTGCLDGNWLHVEAMDRVGSYRERYKLKAPKALLKEMTTEHKGNKLEVTGVVIDRADKLPLSVQTYVGPPDSIGRGVTDLGRVRAQDAADYLLSLAS